MAAAPNRDRCRLAAAEGRAAGGDATVQRRRAQEWLLSGPMGSSGDARQYAAVLGAQLLAYYSA